MADRDILDRLDRHMERGNVLMAEHTRAVEEHRRVVEENSRVIQDLRVFTRDLVTRQERFMDEAIRELRDLRAQSRAQREALLRLIDRLPPAADGPAPA